jgi:hypothetical protein
MLLSQTDPNQRPVHRRWRTLLASLALVLAVASVPIAAWAIPARAPLTQEDDDAENPAVGETIADGRARLPDGDIAWTIRPVEAPGGEGIAFDAFPIGFALVDEGTAALRNEDDEEPTELGEGEAALLPDRKAGSIASADGDTANLYLITLEAAEDAESDEAEGAVVGEPFPAPEGESFAIELVSNTLSGEEEATIPVSGSGAPPFYLTTDGTAQLQAGEQVVELAAGQFALLAGEVQIRAVGDTPATYVFAAIGEEAAARDRGDRADRAERQRTPRERTGGGQGAASAGGQGGGDRQARRAARQAARLAQGGGGRGGQAQQPAPGGGGGAPVTGGADATATVPAPAGTPSGEPTAEPTLPVEPTAPTDGTPPPLEETPPVDETAVPTVPAAETPTPEPTIPVVPTNPPVPEVPGVPGLPTVPAEETIVAESVPEEAIPVEEAPAAPVEGEPTPEG